MSRLIAAGSAVMSALSVRKMLILCYDNDTDGRLSIAQHAWFQ